MLGSPVRYLLHGLSNMAENGSMRSGDRPITSGQASTSKAVLYMSTAKHQQICRRKRRDSGKKPRNRKNDSERSEAHV